MSRNDTAGRVVGMVVFLGGIALLVFVAVTAYIFFSSPTAGIIPTPAKPGVPATAQLGASAMRLILQIMMLILIAVVGSMLSGRGIQLYFASTGNGRRRDRSSAIDDSEAL